MSIRTLLLNTAIASPTPTITVTNEPSTAGIGAIRDGDTPTQIVGRMSDTGAATTSGSGNVTTTITVRVSGATVDASTGLAEDDEATIRVVYSATGATNVVRDLGPITVSAAADFTPVVRGYLPDRDEGTTGDMFVAKNGNDANAGTLAAPKLTIGAAMTAASGGDVIRVRAGTYRETVNFTGKSGTLAAPTTLARYGAEEVVISAAETLTGWTQCTSADEDDVGENFASIYKVSITKTSIAGSDPVNAFLHEDGNRLFPAMLRKFNPFYPEFSKVSSDHLTHNSPQVDGSNNYLGFTEPSLIGFTSAQVLNATALHHRAGNFTISSPISAFNATTGQVTFTNQNATYGQQNTYAFFNFLPAMKRGEWGYIDNGTTATLYLWPTDTANLTANIEYSARGACVVCNDVDHVITRGFILAQASGSATVLANANSKKTNVQLENCMSRGMFTSASGVAAILFANVDKWVVRHVTVLNTVGTFGMFFNGLGFPNADYGGRLDRCELINVESSPIRLFSQCDTIVSYVSARNGGNAAHANKTNFYAGCHNVMWWGCDFASTSGYLTWQAASRVIVAFCNIPVKMNRSDPRGIADQNDPGHNSPIKSLTDAPEVVGTGFTVGEGFIFNNIVSPYGSGLLGKSGIILGRDNEPDITYQVRNLITHGLASSNTWSTVATIMPTSESTARQGLETITSPHSIYQNIRSGNASIKSNSPSRTAATTSIADIITNLKLSFPDFADFDKDMNGQTYAEATPPMGPVVDQDIYPVFSPVWIDRPEVLGATGVGSTLNVTGGYLTAFPYPTITRQWVRSDDAVTWTNITGATGESYTLATADLGKYVGVRSTGAGVSTISTQDGVVAASYPLGNPVLMTRYNDLSDDISEAETATFMATGAPIMVVTSLLGTGTAARPINATIGTAGRTYGTGAALTGVSGTSQSRLQAKIHYIASPTAGATTVQIDNYRDGNTPLISDSIQIAVFEMPSMTGTGAVFSNGISSGIGPATDLTTTAENGAVLFVVSRRDESSSLYDDMVMDGAAILSNSVTGDTALSNNVSVVIGYRVAPSIGRYEALTQWENSRPYLHFAIELES